MIYIATIHLIKTAFNLNYPVLWYAKDVVLTLSEQDKPALGLEIGQLYMSNYVPAAGILGNDKYLHPTVFYGMQ